MQNVLTDTTPEITTQQNGVGTEGTNNVTMNHVMELIRQLPSESRMYVMRCLVEDEDEPLTLDEVFVLARTLSDLQQRQLIARLDLFLKQPDGRPEDVEAAWERLFKLGEELSKMPSYMTTEEAFNSIRGIPYVDDCTEAIKSLP